MAFPTGWTRACKLTIESTITSATLTNFPLLLTAATIPAEPLSAVDGNRAQADGGDLRFCTSSDGTGQLACEVVSWDQAGGTCQIWVLVPSVSHAADTEIWMFWKAGGSETQPGATESFGREAVWADYICVYHLEEDPSGSAPQFPDAGPNDYDLQSSGTMTSGDLVAAKIGNGIDFDGTDDRLSHATLVAMVSGLSGLTIQAWVVPDAFTTEVVAGLGSLASIAEYGFMVRLDGDNDVVFAVSDGSSQSSWTNTFASTVMSAGTAYLLHCTWNSTQQEMFLNGANEGTDGTTVSSLNTASMFLRIGAEGRLTNFFDGDIDEFRLRGSVLSDEWIAAEYNNQNAPGTYITEGTPEDAVFGDTLSVTDQASDRIFQRTAGGTTKTITFAGSYTNTVPTSIEVQILNASDSSVAQAWTALGSASIAGGSWSGTLSVPQGGWYHWEARSKDSGGTVLASAAETSNEWAVGVLVAMIGQSNMRNMWSTRSTPPADDTLTKRHAGAGWYAPDLTRQGSETSSNQGVNDFGGNGAVVFGNQLRAGLELPVGMLQFAIGATAISTWASGGASFTNFESNTVGVARSDVGSDFEFVLWHQGEDDAVAGTTKTNYKTGLDNVYSACRTLTGRSTTTLKFGVGILGNMDNATATDATMDAIRQGQLEWVRDTTGAFFAGCSYDMVRTDTVHWTAPYYERMGRRYAQAVLEQLGEVATGSEGPKISSARRASGSADIYLSVTHDGGTGLEEDDGTTDGGSLTGFEASDDAFSTNLTISSTAFSNGQIKLTLSAAPADEDTIVVRHQYGENPDISNPVYDDQLPQSDTIGFPLQPTIGTVEATLGGGALNMLMMGVG